MYVRVGSEDHDRQIGFPHINGAIEVPVKHFECRPGPRQDLDDFLPQPLSIATRIAMLKEDAGGAAFLAHIAASLLDPPTNEAVQAFAKSFGVGPTVVLKGMKESVGSIVRRRLEGAFKLLSSGALLYSCGLPTKGGGPESPAALDYRFKTRTGQYWVALGRQFWLEPFSDDRFAILLMAALRVAYGEWITERPLSAPLGNVFCYAKFAFLAHEGEPPPFVAERCPEFV